MKRTLAHPIWRAALAGTAPALLITLVILVITTPRSSATSTFASPLLTPTPLQPRPMALPDVSVAIPQPGGRLVSTDGQVFVTFPAGAVKESMTVTLSFNVSRTIPSRFTLIAPAFAVKTQPGSLDAPMTLTVRYAPQPGINEREMTFVYHDAVADKWQPFPTTMDVTQHTATAVTNQASPLALVWRPAILSLPSGAVIVDDLDSGFARFGTSANWGSEYTTTTGYYAGHMYWTYRSTSVRDNYATWTPGATLTSGAYEVYVFVASYNTNTTNARYQIVHQGITTVRPISQSIYFGEWVSLGWYTFGSDPASNYVQLDDLTYEDALTRIGFDAIAFVPPRIYLPVVMKNYPIQIKAKSGMHLGNRSADWINEMLQPIDGENGGIFPSAVVVKSEQLYEIWRGGANCADIAINPQSRAPTLFAYLQRASAAGTNVIIRISPSPGNFVDWNIPAQTNHHLRADNTPAGGTYCELSPGSGDWGFMHYRAVNDIAKEIEQIHNMNKNNGWQEYAFEPANEPNLEWYTTQPTGQTAPRIDQSIAWQEMNSYFVALYDMVKALPEGNQIKLLAPPMAQTRYAEPVFVQSPGCAAQRLSDNQSSFGYNEMRTVYETKNDGLSWHNYWTYGHESILPYCQGGNGEHVLTTFPTWMRDQAFYGSKLTFITEADLADPGMAMGSALTNKDANTTNTRNSIRFFFNVEPAMVRPVMWLLNNNFDDPPGQHENADIKWHQAYTPTVGIRPWFADWWPQPEN